MNRLRNWRKKNQTTTTDSVPEVPESFPGLPDAEELKDAAADKADNMKEMAEDAVTGDMKLLLFKMWLVEKFSCCLGDSEMTKMGAVDIPDTVNLPELPKVDM